MKVICKKCKKIEYNNETIDKCTRCKFEKKYPGMTYRKNLEYTPQSRSKLYKTIPKEN